MKITVFLLFLSFAISSFASVVTSFDEKNNCILYRATSVENPTRKNEILFAEKSSYGFTLQKLEIDFQNEIAKLEIVNRVVLGFNSLLTEEKVFVRSQNPDFNFLINHLNRSVHTFDQVCVTSNNELKWATLKSNQK